MNTLEDKGGEINMTFDGGMWSHDYMGGLESFKIDGKTERSSINNLHRYSYAWKVSAVLRKILAATFM